MRIPPGPRVYLTTALSLAAVGFATWSGMQAGAAPSSMTWWTLGAVAASVTAAGVPAYEQIRKERLRARAERAAIDAAVAMRVTMNDALDPIVRQLGRIATASRHDREALQEAIIPMILDSASHLIDAERVRANWFRFVGERPPVLVPEQYAGRADEPATTFTEGTAEGDAAFAMIRHNEHLTCVDVDTQPPPGWHGPAHHGYKSFIAVPVVAGHTAFGMLTVDTVEVAGVTEAEVPLVRLLAGLLASALAQGQADNGLRRYLQ
jgi:GAF domain-containing protein